MTWELEVNEIVVINAEENVMIEAKSNPAVFPYKWESAKYPPIMSPRLTDRYTGIRLQKGFPPDKRKKGAII